MSDHENSKPYDLEERTAVFAEQSRALVRRLARTIGNVEDARQLIRASGSIGANYIEANDAIREKGFSDESQNLPKGSQGERLLASLARHGRQT